MATKRGTTVCDVWHCAQTWRQCCCTSSQGCLYVALYLSSQCHVPDYPPCIKIWKAVVLSESPGKNLYSTARPGSTGPCEDPANLAVTATYLALKYVEGRPMWWGWAFLEKSVWVALVDVEGMTPGMDDASNGWQAVMWDGQKGRLT